MTSISAAKLLTRFETYLAGVFHPIPSHRRGHTVILRLGFSISSQCIHLRGSKVSCRREREHDATGIGDHRLCCARGLLLVVHHCRSPDTISLCEAQATRSAARMH